MERVSPKLRKYERIILEMLNDIKGDRPDIYVLADKEKRHYQLMYAGFDASQMFYCQIGIHLQLRQDGVICIFANDTEYELLDYLLPKGIPQTSILIHYLTPSLRQIAGYAVV